jgi:hypothetical protein
MSVVLVALVMCVSAYGDPIFTLTPSNATPQSGDTVTLTLNFDGTDPGVGLIFARYDLGISKPSGGATWDTPTGPTSIPRLSADCLSTPGIPTADCVDDVILAVDLLATSWDNTIGSASPMDVWTVNLKVYGNPGDPIDIKVMSEWDATAGCDVYYSNDVQITDPTQLASTRLTITAVPEPATLVLVGLGGVLLARRRRRAR